VGAGARNDGRGGWGQERRSWGLGPGTAWGGLPPRTARARATAFPPQRGPVSPVSMPASPSAAPRPSPPSGRPPSGPRPPRRRWPRRPCADAPTAPRFAGPTPPRGPAERPSPAAEPQPTDPEPAACRITHGGKAASRATVAGASTKAAPGTARPVRAVAPTHRQVGPHADEVHPLRLGRRRTPPQARNVCLRRLGALLCPLLRVLGRVPRSAHRLEPPPHGGDGAVSPRVRRVRRLEPLPGVMQLGTDALSVLLDA